MLARNDFGFLLKAVVAIALVILADRLFWAGGGIGSNLGWFAGAWAIGTLLVMRSVRRDGRALTAIGIAIGLAVVLADDPSPIGWLLFWSALVCAALLPRIARFGGAGAWAIRLFAHGIVSMVGPWHDLIRLRRVQRRGRGRASRARAILPLLPLPLLGLGIFLVLFAEANPVIGDALAQIGLPDLDWSMIGRAFMWMAVLTMVWATLRPRQFRVYFPPAIDAPPRHIPGVSVGSVTLSLIAFNALFALQNGLDLTFLWSGAPLPKGITLAAYAHRGAYPLIVTALLAGVFVLVTLRPGSDTAAVPSIRWLVVAWVFQNVFLVASSILRTIDYIDAYSLTILRIAALIWMGLVAVGLLLILWRMLTGKSATWLINANAIAAGLVLAGASAIDLGSVAAAWNVRHAHEVGGRGTEIDLCYLRGLGPSALVSLIELEQHPWRDVDFADRIAWVRRAVLRDTLDTQKTGNWTWRNARRLDQVGIMMTGHRYPTPKVKPNDWTCDGTDPEAPYVPDVSDEDTAANASAEVSDNLTGRAAR